MALRRARSRLVRHGRLAAVYLVERQGSAKYLVAASGSQTTAPIIIQTGKAVVTIGEVKYVLVSGGGPGRGNADIASWVTEHGTEVSGYSGLYAVTGT